MLRFGPPAEKFSSLNDDVSPPRAPGSHFFIDREAEEEIRLLNAEGKATLRRFEKEAEDAGFPADAISSGTHALRDLASFARTPLAHLQQSEAEEGKGGGEGLGPCTPLIACQQAAPRDLPVTPSGVSNRDIPPSLPPLPPYVYTEVIQSMAVGPSLAERAKQEHVDAIVCGSRGLGAVQRGLLGLLGLGSQSSYLVTHAPCPVMVSLRF